MITSTESETWSALDFARKGHPGRFSENHLANKCSCVLSVNSSNYSVQVISFSNLEGIRNYTTHSSFLSCLLFSLELVGSKKYMLPFSPCSNEDEIFCDFWQLFMFTSLIYTVTPIAKNLHYLSFTPILTDPGIDRTKPFRTWLHRAKTILSKLYSSRGVPSFPF